MELELAGLQFGMLTDALASQWEVGATDSLWSACYDWVAPES